VTPEERQQRFLEVSAELAEIERLEIVDLEREGELLEELDRIEYEVGMDEFENNRNQKGDL
jgi:hypothetical protein